MKELMPLALCVSMLTACASGTTTLKPSPIRCDPTLMAAPPAKLSILDEGTAGEIVAAHHRDAADFQVLRERHARLAECVRAYQVDSIAR